MIWSLPSPCRPPAGLSLWPPRRRPAGLSPFKLLRRRFGSDAVAVAAAFAMAGLPLLVLAQTEFAVPPPRLAIVPEIRAAMDELAQAEDAARAAIAARYEAEQNLRRLQAKHPKRPAPAPARSAPVVLAPALAGLAASDIAAAHALLWADMAMLDLDGRVEGATCEQAAPFAARCVVAYSLGRRVGLRCGTTPSSWCVELYEEFVEVPW